MKNAPKKKPRLTLNDSNKAERDQRRPYCSNDRPQIFNVEKYTRVTCEKCHFSDSKVTQIVATATYLVSDNVLT